MLLNKYENMNIVKLKNRQSFFGKKKYIIKTKRYIKYILIFILIILIFFLIFRTLFIFNKQKKIIIEVDISKSFYDGGGPVQLSKALRDVLPYETEKCRFIASRSMTPKNGKNKTDYFYLPFPCLAESVYEEWSRINRSQSLLLGPCFVPINWNLFPYKGIWKERRFREILETIKGLVVHSKRIREHLSTRSNTTDLLYKYKFLRPCTGIMPKSVEKFENRKIDIIYFEKFPDLNRRKQSKQLLNYFKSTDLKIIRMKYGNYTKKELMDIANNTKFVIYFSFFDTGAIALKEIQNYGVFCFTHEEEFVISDKTSFLIPELHDEFNMKPAFDKIMKIMQKVSNSNPNTQLIAQINQDINKCQRALDDLCEGI